MMNNDNDNQPNIIPFGKYKGQPADVLVADPQYVEWLNGQGWVKDKYPQFYTVIINNFQEPSDTPEHNAIQALFLDDEICLRLSSIVFSSTGKQPLLYGVGRKQFEVDAIDILLEYRVWEWAEHEGVRIGRWERWYDWDTWSYMCAIEVKPSIGDDFPAILRQARRLFGISRHNIKQVCVVFRDFVATSVTLEQVRAMFKASNVFLFSLDEIQQTSIAVYPDRDSLPPK